MRHQREKKSLCEYDTSPVIHANVYDWLANNDGPSDNTTAIVSARPNVKTGFQQNE
jgi:alkyl hydroperoxide reductase subunit AhpF